MGEFTHLDLFPFKEGLIGRAGKLGPVERQEENVAHCEVSGWSECSKGGKMKGFTFVCAEFCMCCDLHILTHCVENFFFFGGPG